VELNHHPLLLLLATALLPPLLPRRRPPLQRKADEKVAELPLQLLPPPLLKLMILAKAELHKAKLIRIFTNSSSKIVYLFSTNPDQGLVIVLHYRPCRSCIVSWTSMFHAQSWLINLAASTLLWLAMNKTAST
jgi:hypothetical protein